MIDIMEYRCRIGIFHLQSSSYSSHSSKSRSGYASSSCSNLKNFSFVIKVLLLFFLLLTLCLPTYHSPYQPLKPHKRIVHNNFWARYINGNGRGDGIRIIHWNKGSSFLENKKDELEAVIEKHKPHIFGLSEANLFLNHNQDNVQFSGYKLFTCPSLNNTELYQES